jgi:DtxR family Mn-dependent transcriptional regulator
MTGKTNDPTPSPAVEDYLKAIYQLAQEGRPVSTSAIADRLGVAAASVTGMLKRLADQDLVEHIRYRGASLTGSGEVTAIRLVRRHRILELFLVSVLGYTWDTVHDQAERLEHAASDELIDRMAHILGEPAVDPHGDPIPAAAGPFREPDWPALSDLSTNRPAVLRRVSDADPEVLRYLAGLGLRPGVHIVVTHHAPFGGPVTVRAGDQSHVLGRALCGTIQVEPIGTQP